MNHSSTRQQALGTQQTLGTPPNLIHIISCLLLVLAISACAANNPSRKLSSNDSQAVVRVHPSDDLNDAALAARRLATEFGKEQVLIAFDLDNTLLAMRTAIGSDQWYDWQKRLQLADPCDPRLVNNRLASQGALYHVGAMRPTQADAADIVANLQNDGFTTLIVTARGKEFRLPTFRELRRNGLTFRDTSIGPLGGFNDHYLPPGAQRSVRFEDGVYMLAGQHKGDMLLALYQKLGLALPRAVVFADDKSKNVQSVADAMRKAGIHAELFVYQRETVDQFDETSAAADWATLKPALQAIETVMGSVNFDLPGRPTGATSCAN